MLKCIDPATGEVIERLCCDDRRTVHRTFRNLEEGQKRWSDQPREDRVRAVAQFAQLLDEQRTRILEWLVRQVGTPVRQARAEVDVACERIEQFCQACVADDDVAPAYDSRRGSQRVEREPFGVVAHISTWSFPCLVGVEVMVPALLAGNSVLYKPSEHASLVGRELIEMMWEAGIAKDVIDLVIGDGSVGDYVLDEAVSGVFFTGTYPTGQMISQKLASRLIPQHFALGGKDGAYVCEDVDVEQAARRVADLAYYNSGRGRRAFDRLYVHETIYRRFTQALCQYVDSYRLGDPGRETTCVGPVVDSRQLDTLEHQLGDAVRKGARILLGGRVRGGQGNYFEPTVVTDVDHRMLLMREETMGPVLAVQRVCDDQEAMYRLEDTDYGLVAGVFSADRQRARRLLRALNAASVYWSRCGGQVSSTRPLNGQPVGVGLLGDREGLNQFTRPKAWVMER